MWALESNGEPHVARVHRGTYHFEASAVAPSPGIGLSLNPKGYDVVELLKDN
jgi:hypothetical protein